MQKPVKSFEEILQEQPDIVLKINDYEAKGATAIVAVVIDEDGVKCMAGGQFSINDITNVLSAMDSLKERLAQQAETIVADILETMVADILSGK